MAGQPTGGRAAGTALNARSPVVARARRLTKRAFRAADRAFLVEGAQGVTEALAASALTELFATDDALRRHDPLVRQAERQGVPVHQVGAAVLAQLAGTVTPQGLVGVAPALDVSLEHVLARPVRLVAVLAAVRDPGNAGTVVRVADAAGADAVVFCGTSVDPFNGKCVRATAGSIFHLPVVVAGTAGDVVDDLRSAGLRVLAADGSASTDLDAAEADGWLAGPVAWVFGNEAWGLPAGTADGCDASVAVPILGQAESLNLATAAAVCLYATVGARRRVVGG